MGRNNDEGRINPRAHNRKVISWARVKKEMRRRSKAGPRQNSVGESPVVRMFPESMASRLETGDRPRRTDAFQGEFPTVDSTPGSCGAAGRAEHWGHPSPEPRISSATRNRLSPDALSPDAGACSDPTVRRFGPKDHACPIMGKNLPNSQWVELYQPETHYPDEVLALTGMAKPLAKHEEDMLAALRANLEALRGKMSQSEIGLAAGALRSRAQAVGRNVTNLTAADKGVKGNITTIPVAAKAYGIEPWQLWVPLLHSLQPEERRQLHEIVRLFVETPIARPLLTGALTLATGAAANVEDALASGRTAANQTVRTKGAR